MSTPHLKLGSNMYLTADVVTRGLSISTSTPREIVPSSELNAIIKTNHNKANLVSTLLYGMVIELCSTFDKYRRTEERNPHLMNDFLSEYAESVYAIPTMADYDWIGLPAVKPEFILPLRDQPLFLVEDGENTLACLAFASRHVSIFGSLDNAWSLVIPAFISGDGYTQADYYNIMWYYAAHILLHKSGIWSGKSTFGSYAHKPYMRAASFGQAMAGPGIPGLKAFIAQNVAAILQD